MEVKSATAVTQWVRAPPLIHLESEPVAWSDSLETAVLCVAPSLLHVNLLCPDANHLLLLHVAVTPPWEVTAEKGLLNMHVTPFLLLTLPLALSLELTPESPEVPCTWRLKGS